MGGEVPDASAADGRRPAGRPLDRCLCRRESADEERAAARHVSPKGTIHEPASPMAVRFPGDPQGRPTLLERRPRDGSRAGRRCACPGAELPYVTGGRLAFCMDNGRVDLGQQVTAHVGQNVFLCLHVNLSDGSVANVTQNGNTSYSVGTGTGYIRHFELVELYVPPAADANKQFPLYAIYHDACKNVDWTFTVSLHVIP